MHIVCAPFTHPHDSGWPALLQVFLHSVQKHIPDAVVHVQTIDPPEIVEDKKPAWTHNTVKLRAQIMKVLELPDGACVAILDTDLLVLQDFREVFTEEFDIGCTRSQTSGFINCGVIFVKLHPRSRNFLEAWLSTNEHLYADPEVTRRVSLPRLGINQEAFFWTCRMLGNTLAIKEFPCHVYNLCTSEHTNFDPEVTKVVHYKDGLRTDTWAGRTGRYGVLVGLWHQYFTESGGDSANLVVGDAIADEIRRSRDALGYTIDLTSPRSFNEKVIWTKLYDRRALIATACDKLASRELVRARGFEHILVPLVQIADNVDDINYGHLDEVVVKSTAGSGTNIFIRKKRWPHSEISFRNTIRRWLTNSYGDTKNEWGYGMVQPKVFIEQLLDEAGGPPNVYRLFTYHQKVHFVMIYRYEYAGKKPRPVDITTYRLGQRKAERIEVAIGNKPIGRTPLPANFREMLTIAKELSEGFDFVRVDFLSAHGNIFFSELTPYPASGRGKFDPVEVDYEFGEPWRLSSKNSPGVQ